MRLLSTLLIMFVGVGCSNLNRPTASVKGMSLKDVNTSGFTMNFDVEVANPNTVDLPFTDADYKIALGGVQVLEGKAKPDGAIPANGSKSVAFPVTMSYENLLAAEKAIVKSGGNIEYAFDAGLSVRTGAGLFGDARVPLKYSGTLALKDILNNPGILLQSPAARKLAEQLLGSLFGK